MIDRYRSELAVGALLFVLGVVAVGTLALSGAAATQPAGSVDVEDTIYTDQSSFDVQYDANRPGCLDVYKNGEYQTTAQINEAGSGSKTISVNDIGGINSGDNIRAELVLEGSTSACESAVAEDSTTVVQAGTVELQDPIYADQSEFEVSVTELRLDGGRTRGCVIVSNSGGSTVELTMQEGETQTVTESQVGSFRNGDQISAELTDDGKCSSGEQLDTESTTVQATGSVDIDDTIITDQSEFEATVTELRVDGDQACLDIEKNGGFEVRRDVTEGQTLTFTQEEVGGFREGDELEAELLPNSCEGPLDTDTTTVSVAGTVQLEDPIYGDDDSFEVRVTELRIDDETGCVRIDNSGSDEGFYYAEEFSEGETRLIAENDVGSYDVGDEITATLVANSFCDGSDVDSSSTTVTAAPEETPTPTATPTATETATATATPTPTPDSGDGTDESQPRFNVTIDEVRVPENQGDPIEVETTVRNNGTGPDTQTVVLTGDGEERDSQEVTLEPGESQTVTFTWEEPGEAQQRMLEVASENDTDESALRAETETDGEEGGSIPGGAGGILLLLLLLALLVAYYYVRRRQMERGSPDVGADESD